MCKENSFKLLIKAIGLLVIVLALAAFSGIKDTIYYQLHIEEAKALNNGRCKAIDDDDSIFGKDIECQAAKKAIAKNIEIKSRDALIEELNKKKEKLTGRVKVGDSEKPRYEIFKSHFSEDIELTGDFIIECFKSDMRVVKNGVECLAAVEQMLDTLTRKRDLEAAEIEREIKYKETYQHEFRENPARVDELLEGRCKELFTNPWYQYDASLQDKECNVAVLEKERQKRLGTVEQKVEIKEDDKKNTEYIQISKEKKKYSDIFRDDVMSAKKVVDNCNAGTEDDKVKCEVANNIYSENINSKRDKKEFERFVNYYKQNSKEAHGLIQGKCKNFAGAGDNGIFIEDTECAAALEAIKINEVIKGRDELIAGMRDLKSKTGVDFDKISKADLEKYKTYKGYFREDPADAEKFISSCVSSSDVMKKDKLNCAAAIDAVLARLEDEKERDLAEMDKESKYKEYYRKYFWENREEAYKLLEGRCKVLFSDPWYGYDPDTQDRECDAAKAEIWEFSRQQKAAELEKQKAEIKDMAYYRRNVEERAALLAECQNGVINDLRACEMSLKVTHEMEDDAKKRKEYIAFYSGHFLAAQFHLRWCKSVMINFDTECQVVAEVLKDHKDRVEDPALVKKYTDFFSTNPIEAKIAILGTCAQRLADSWYFLDRNLQTEECNAAVDRFMDY